MTFHQSNQFKFKTDVYYQSFSRNKYAMWFFFEDMGERGINYSVSIKVYRG